MANILVLISRLAEYRLDNHSLIPNALHELGHTVDVGDIETLTLAADGAQVKGFRLDQKYPDGVPFPDFRLEPVQIGDNIDLVWVLANPHPAVFVETYQILWAINQMVRFVNRADSLFYLNSKITLGVAVPDENVPNSLVSSSDRDFFDLIDSGDRWVLKPANEGCGAMCTSSRRGSRTRGHWCSPRRVMRHPG